MFKDKLARIQLTAFVLCSFCHLSECLRSARATSFYKKQERLEPIDHTISNKLIISTLKYLKECSPEAALIMFIASYVPSSSI